MIFQLFLEFHTIFDKITMMINGNFMSPAAPVLSVIFNRIFLQCVAKNWRGVKIIRAY